MRTQSATGASASRPDRSEALGTRHHCALLPCQTGYLGHQAGLPDASTAADQRKTGAASCGSPPQILEQTQLSRPADELYRGEPGATGSRLGRQQRCTCWIYLSHQALERLPRRRARNDGELTLQDRSAMVVGAHRTGTVAQVGLQQHQGAVADLLQRFQLEPAAGGLHRSG